MELSNKIIAIIGLGYVGLPLAVEFGKKYNVIGFDIDENRINDLKQGIDKTKETVKSDIESSIFLNFSNVVSDLGHANVFIVTVVVAAILLKDVTSTFSPLSGASVKVIVLAAKE